MKVLFSIMKYNFRQTIERAGFRYTILIQPILFSLLFYFINKSGGNRIQPILLIMKSGALSLWSSVCYSSLCDLQREKDTRTLGALLGTPTSLITIITGKVIPNTVLGLISFAMSSITICIISGLKGIEFSILGLVLSLILLLFSYIIVALSIIPLLAISDKGRILINFIEYPIYILTGMAFPITFLPNMVQIIGKIIPITWSIQILNDCAINGLSVLTFNKVFGYSTSMIIYIIISILLFKKIEKMIRKKALINI